MTRTSKDSSRFSGGDGSGERLEADVSPKSRSRFFHRFFPLQALAMALVFSMVLDIPLQHALEKNPVKTVVLLHGLARSRKSMNKMEKALQENGYKTCNLDYPSTGHPVEELATRFALPAIKRCAKVPDEPVHFVTHSMGGIVVRYLAANAPEIHIGRVVMLSPPNRGSEVVDSLGDIWPFEWINGPAGKQLGTGPDSLPNTLGPATFELGIVTGDRSINWVLSGIIDGEDDGKVSVERAKLEGMADFIVIHATHPFIMKNDLAIEQTIHFLAKGKFKRE